MKFALMARQAAFGLAFVVAPHAGSVPAPVKATPTKAGGSAVTAITDITNVSDKQVWLTVYWSYKALATWHIEKATCLTPGAKWNGAILYRTPELGPQIRVRAEVMHGDCRSSVYRDVEGKADIPTNITPPTPRVHAYIKGSNGNYNVDVKASIL
ncbi:MAG TPA: hypothetical protein VIJ16_02960 [Gemmatimonadaceae bacterium]